MRQLIHNIKTYLNTLRTFFTCKQKVLLYVKKDNSLGMTYFNMSEEQARQYLFITFDSLAYKHIVQSEIEHMTK